MTNESCYVPYLIQEMRRNKSKSNPTECYDYYSQTSEDIKNFGLAKDSNISTFNEFGDRVTNISAWIYQTQDEIQGTPFNGRLGYYSGGGSYQVKNHIVAHYFTNFTNSNVIGSSTF